MAHIGLKYILLCFCQINNMSADCDKLGISIFVRDLACKVKLSLCLTNEALLNDGVWKWMYRSIFS
jgi:hypothetical protein